MPDSTERTYEVVTSSGALRITVPAGTRVTYGPVVSVAGKSSYGGNVIRFWQGSKGSATEVQLALFENVTSFRDMSLPVLVQAVRRFGTGEGDWFQDTGKWVGKNAELVERGWKPIDDLIDPPTEAIGNEPEPFSVPLRGMKPRADREF